MRGIRFPRPFAGNHAIMLMNAIMALSPYIVLTTAASLYREQIAKDLGAGLTSLSIIAELGVAGYAFGAMLGGYLIQRFPQRPLFLVNQLLFVIGCSLSAGAGITGVYGLGRFMSGFATGLLLVVALPPVIQSFPASNLRISAAFINIGFFGAITIGPLLGGAVARGGGWRWFDSAIAGIGLANFVVALFTLPDREALNPDVPLDKSGILLAFAATMFPFSAAGLLTDHSFDSLYFIVPMAVGLTCLVILLLTQYHKKEPLSPVKPMWHSFPIIGTLAAMIGGGAFFTFIELIIQYQHEIMGTSMLMTGLYFWPQVPGVIVTAGLLGLVLGTRYLPILVLSGMLMVIGAGVLLLSLPTEGSHGILLGAIALMGLGAGGSVAPGLFMAGLSLPAHMLGRIFALVELVRSIFDFILGPVMLKVARISSSGSGLTLDGVKTALFVTVVITAVTTLFGVGLYFIGAGFRLPKTNLDDWLGRKGPGMSSPNLGEAFPGRKETGK